MKGSGQVVVVREVGSAGTREWPPSVGLYLLSFLLRLSLKEGGVVKCKVHKMMMEGHHRY